MQKRKPRLSPEEQSAENRQVALLLIAAGKLRPNEADRAADPSLRKRGAKKTVNIVP
jgi:hypothetical protein